MQGNTFGEVFRVTTFGESHGAALGCVIDGMPSGIKIDIQKIQDALDKRKPGATTNGKANAAVTSRAEADKAEILSGVFNGFSEGTPIAIVIKNTSQHSSDYENLATTFRPGHADYTYFTKYGFRDYRGGGRSSGRETCARVASGAVAQMLLEEKLGKKFCLKAYTLRAAGIQCNQIDYNEINKNQMRAPDSVAANLMIKKIEKLKEQGNSAGGIIECRIDGVPPNLGEGVFSKLDAELAKAMLSIGAIKGIEFGLGFKAADSMGKDNNDEMFLENGKARFATNNSGGILGGISNGNEIVFRVAVKPVPSIFIPQKTISAQVNPNIPVDNLSKNDVVYKETELQIKGRHDVCLCPRIVPVVESMAYITLADMLLRAESSSV